MELHGVLGDAEERGDLAVGAAGSEMLHHFELAMRQRSFDLGGRLPSLVEHRRSDLGIGGDEIVRQGPERGVQLVRCSGSQQHRPRSCLERLNRLAWRRHEHQGGHVQVADKSRRRRCHVDENHVRIHDPHPRGHAIVDLDVADHVKVVEPIEERRQADAREPVGRGHDDAQRPLGRRRTHRYELQGWTHSGYHPRALNVRKTPLDGVVLLEPKVYSDERGFFIETYRADHFRDAGIPETFVQDNHSRSQRGVLRGLHYQEPNPQGKLVRCSRGAMFDVAVDIRAGSPQFGKWLGVELSESNRLMLWVPAGFAHGFCALTDDCDVLYKVTTFYDPAADRSILWNDPEIGIAWPVPNPRLSPKDAAAPRLKEAKVLPKY